MNFKVIDNKTLLEKKTKIPKILPNNIRLISNRFKLTDAELAEKLNVKPNYINLVKNENANLSGKTALKLMIELNIPFNLIYNVNRKVDVSYENFTERYIILKVDNKIDLTVEDEETMGNIADFIINYLKEVSEYNEKEDIYIQKYVDNLIPNEKKNGYCLNLNCKESNITVAVAKKYREVVHDISLMEGNYILVGYELRKVVNKTKEFINLQENLNLDLLKYLYDCPFVIEKEISLENFSLNYNYDLEMLYLDKEYNFYKDGHFVVSNEIEGKYIELYERNNRDFVKFKIYSFIKLKALRLKLGLTIQEMADILEVESGSYLLIENGLQRISTQLMWIIEKTFGITIDSIIDVKKYYEFFYNSTCDES